MWLYDKHLFDILLCEKVQYKIILVGLQVIPRLFTAPSQSVDAEHVRPSQDRRKKPSMWKLMCLEMRRKRRFESYEVPKQSS